MRWFRLVPASENPIEKVKANFMRRFKVPGGKAFEVSVLVDYYISFVRPVPILKAMSSALIRALEAV